MSKVSEASRVYPAVYCKHCGLRIYKLEDYWLTLDGDLNCYSHTSRYHFPDK